MPPPVQQIEPVATAPAPELAPDYKGLVLGRGNEAPDGTITLDMDCHFKDGTVLHTRYVVPPGNPDYKDVVKHYGPFVPGKEKVLLSDGHGEP